MSKESGFFSRAIEDWDQGLELMERLVSVAEPSAVFAEPIQAGERTIITASEASIGLGFGYGFGGGSAPELDVEGAEQPEGSGYGGGGGGGGGGSARPVAAIIVEPQGVRIEPIVDVTKLGLAFFTTLASMFVMAGKIRKATQG